MRLNEVTFTDALPVEGYGIGFFRIGGTVEDAPLVILPTGVSRWGGFEDSATLLAAVDHVDILFIGTGPDIAHIPSEMRTALEDAGIGVEVMASPAAARTYNVLLSEGRRVGVALLSV